MNLVAVTQPLKNVNQSKVMTVFLPACVTSAL